MHINLIYFTKDLIEKYKRIHEIYPCVSRKIDLCLLSLTQRGTLWNLYFWSDQRIKGKLTLSQNFIRTREILLDIKICTSLSDLYVRSWPNLRMVHCVTNLYTSSVHPLRFLGSCWPRNILVSRISMFCGEQIPASHGWVRSRPRRSSKFSIYAPFFYELFRTGETIYAEDLREMFRRIFVPLFRGFSSSNRSALLTNFCERARKKAGFLFAGKEWE